jgi:hypothetical protein
MGKMPGAERAAVPEADRVNGGYVSGFAGCEKSPLEGRHQGLWHVVAAARSPYKQGVPGAHNPDRFIGRQASHKLPPRRFVW